MSDITLPGETRIAIAGDWHSSGVWAKTALALLHRHAPDVKTILHLGDFNLTTNEPWKSYRNNLIKAMATNGVARILVTPGNHDHWGQLTQQFTQHPDSPYVLPKTNQIAFLPRCYRFSIMGRSFLSFGGAASPDQEGRFEGKDWWPSEEPSPEDAADALAGGKADVMLTHEAVTGGTRVVDEILRRTQGQGFGPEGLRASRRSQAVVTDLWQALAPPLLFHGHMHVRAEGSQRDGRTVYALAANNSAGNIGVLDLRTMTWAWLD